MAIATGGALTHGRKSAVSSRNIAFLSILGVLSGSYLVFRSRSPIVSDQEREKMRGHHTSQTDQDGTQIARAPEKSLR